MVLNSNHWELTSSYSAVYYVWFCASCSGGSGGSGDTWWWWLASDSASRLLPLTHQSPVHGQLDTQLRTGRYSAVNVKPCSKYPVPLRSPFWGGSRLVLWTWSKPWHFDNNQMEPPACQPVSSRSSCFLVDTASSVCSTNATAVLQPR